VKGYVFVPSYRSAQAECVSLIGQSVTMAAMKGHELQVIYHSGALADDGRNECLATLTPDVDFALFIDDDMVPEPEAISKIIALEKPVASALLTTRSEPVALAIKVWSHERQGYFNIQNFRTDRAQEGDFGVGAAFLFLSSCVVDDLREYYLSAQDWAELHRQEHDRLHVRVENREAERKRKEHDRRSAWSRDRYLRIFERDIRHERRQGEDISLSWRIMQCGYKVTVDPTIQVGHRGVRDFSHEDYVPAQHEEFSFA
jgi:hypothetical protein